MPPCCCSLCLMRSKQREGQGANQPLTCGALVGADPPSRYAGSDSCNTMPGLQGGTASGAPRGVIPTSRKGSDTLPPPRPCLQGVLLTAAIDGCVASQQRHRQVEDIRDAAAVGGVELAGYLAAPGGAGQGGVAGFGGNRCLSVDEGKQALQHLYSSKVHSNPHSASNGHACCCSTHSGVGGGA